MTYVLIRPFANYSAGSIVRAIARLWSRSANCLHLGSIGLRHYGASGKRIKAKEELNPEYLKLILNIYQKIGIFFNICTNWNNQSGINVRLLKTVKIPVPFLSTQTKIAEKVKSIYSQAQKLKKQANNNLQTAKEKVEEIIFDPSLKI